MTLIISGKTKVYGVIGDPIIHSLSPVIQNAAFNHNKLDSVFLAFPVNPSGLKCALQAIPCIGIKGLNVTMPHKHAVIDYLDELDSASTFLSSVNTILNINNKLIGFSTDGAGALKALKENFVSVKGKKVVLLGAGGSAKSIAYSLSPEVDKLVVLNRTFKKTNILCSFLREKFDNKITGIPFSTKNLKNAIQNSDILINATSVGMDPNTTETLVPYEYLKSNLVVMDIVYTPLETQLLKYAKAAGAKIINGVEMLIYQGAASFEIWTGQKAPIEIMRNAVLSYLRGEKN